MTRGGLGAGARRARATAPWPAVAALTAALASGALQIALTLHAAVTLVYFRATVEGTEVRLEWETATEFESAGFFVQRGREAGGPFTRASGFIPSAGDGPTGARYDHTDSPQPAAGTWWYQLEEIDYQGRSTLHGPEAATFAVPTAVVSLSPWTTAEAPPTAPPPADPATASPTVWSPVTSTPRAAPTRASPVSRATGSAPGTAGPTPTAGTLATAGVEAAAGSAPTSGPRRPGFPAPATPASTAADTAAPITVAPTALGERRPGERQAAPQARRPPGTETGAAVATPATDAPTTVPRDTNARGGRAALLAAALLLAALAAGWTAVRRRPRRAAP